MFSELNKLDMEHWNRLLMILLVSIVICGIKLFLFYSFHGLGEIWFEEGYQYYEIPKRNGFFQALLIDAGGYIQILPKLVSIVILKFFNWDFYYPYLFKIINNFLFSLFISLLLLKDFDKYLGSKLSRLIIILLVSIYPHYDMSIPNNSPYACIIPIIWFIIKLNSDKPIKYIFYPLYIVSIPIIFICKPLISFAAVPITFIAMMQKIYKKNYSNISLLSLAFISCSFQYVYVKYLTYWQINSITKSFDVSFSILSLLKILDFSIVSTGMSLLGHTVFSIGPSNNFIYISIIYILGTLVALYSIIFLTSKNNIKNFTNNTSIILIFLWLVIFLHASAAIWNSIYVYAQAHLYELKPFYYLNRQYWPIFTSSLIMCLLLFNVYSPSIFAKKMLCHNLFFFIVFIASIIFYRPFPCPYCTTPNCNICPSDWSNYIASNVSGECILANHFSQTIFCDHVGGTPTEGFYVKNGDNFADFFVLNAKQNFDFLVLKIDTPNLLCKEVSLHINNIGDIKPVFIPNNNYYMFRLTQKDIAGKIISMKSPCVKGGWVYLMRTR